MKGIGLIINNKIESAELKETFTSFNPCTGDAIAEVQKCTKNDVNRAIAAAKKAFDKESWSQLDCDTRGKYLHRVADCIERRLEEFAKWEALDTGKPIRETRMIDIPLAIRAFRYHADNAKSLHGEVIPIPGQALFDYTTYEPYGVVGCISPWNFPIHLMTRSIGAALAAGNTVVCKAAVLTPISAFLLGECFIEAGVPEGVFNLVSGEGSVVGEAILAHDDVAMVALTGSEQVGRRLMTASAEAKHIKKLALELGGKSPILVEADCDMEAAINAVALGFCMNQGEVCVSSSRLLLAAEIYDEFLKKLIVKLKTIKIGDSMDETTQMGSLISADHLGKVDGFVQRAVKAGARILCGGEQLTNAPYDKGNYYLPTVLDNVTKDMEIFQEEVFGPVLAVTKYHNLDEGVELANATRFALGAAIFTENMRKMYRLAKKIDAGTIWMNCATKSNIEAPFGGNKNSGLGRENGKEGIIEYMKVKNHIWFMGDPYDNFFEFDWEK